MDSKISRRSFVIKSAIALGTAVACDLTGMVLPGKESAYTTFASEGVSENEMAHVSVKLWPGRSERIKQRLSDAIVEDIAAIIGSDEESVTIAIEEVSSGEWKEKVYDPEIRENMKNLYKKPGYSM